MASQDPSELKILTPIGMLGYSFDERLFWDAIDEGVDAIILDSGSTDSGPVRLALGQTSVAREAYVRDLKVLVSACHYRKVPLLIGSAGGDGTTPHVALLVEIISELVETEGFRPLKLVTIEAEIPKELVHKALAEGQISPCGGGVPALEARDINDPPVIVAQMGLEPWLKALQTYPDLDIIIAGRSYDPAPYAAFCLYKGFSDLGLAYHMGKIMECGAVCATPKSAEAIAIVRKASFDIRPLNPNSKCTPLSVAAHTMYENSRPDLHIGPGGTLDVAESKYEQLSDGRTIRVTRSKFMPVSHGGYTIKLEAARKSGYLAIFIGGIRDPIMISQLNLLVPLIEQRLHAVFDFEFKLAVKFYGKDSVVNGVSLPSSLHEVGVLGKVLASTQEQAKAVANLAKVFFIHVPYPGQVATAGNFMMPLSPCDISVGPATEFCVYHTMLIPDPVEPFPIRSQVIQSTREVSASTHGPNAKTLPTLTPSAESRAGNPVPSALTQPLSSSIDLPFPKVEGHVPLYKLAKTLRTKNAGPYQITLDVLFPTQENYDRVFRSGVLTRETILKLYGLEGTREDELLECMWWEPALAFKATMKRVRVSGGWEDEDVHGSGGHVGVMGVMVPDV
ncbi:hypothetical protein QBC43DRAFT_296961 [Cladorrhinum sp. PSN259]|nr:hypothetical protein QBC43DRAFT_296961 [Cladorrhinum sp. PSN259]